MLTPMPIRGPMSVLGIPCSDEWSIPRQAGMACRSLFFLARRRLGRSGAALRGLGLGWASRFGAGTFCCLLGRLLGGNFGDFGGFLLRGGGLGFCLGRRGLVRF